VVSCCGAIAASVMASRVGVRGCRFRSACRTDLDSLGG
jgi:hypothetical protein